MATKTSSNQKIKRLLIILVCVLAAAAIGFLIFIFGLSKGYTFNIQNSGSIQITGFWGDKVNAEIPSSILGRSVTSIIDLNEPALVRLELPESIGRIYPQGWSSSTKLAEIHVDRFNPAFSSEDGVLFSDSCYLDDDYTERQMVQLVMYPPYKEGTSYTVPNSVLQLSTFAFHNCKNLREVHIPSSVISIEGNLFSGSSVTDVYYHGTQSQWERIDFSYGASLEDSGINVHFVGN